MPEPQEGTLYGFQIDDVDGEKVAQDLRTEPSARGHTRGCFQGRDEATSSCRLIMDITQTLGITLEIAQEIGEEH